MGIDNPFVHADHDTVLLNPALVDAWDLRAAVLHDLTRVPVTVSYAIDRALWGFSSFGFHVTNFILHIVAVGLFYGVCTRALADAVGSEPSLTPEWPAFSAAAAFAVHPLMGSAVAYISARSELLCALGFLASLTFARRAIVASSTTAGVMALAFGLLAVASSVSALALPLVVLAYDAWVLGGEGWRRRALRVYLPAFAAIAVAAAWHVPALLAAERVPARGLAGNALMESVVIWRYAGLLVAPYGQALVHQVHWATSLVDPAGLLALALLVAAVAAAIYARGSRPLLAFGIVWFVAVLAPTSSVIPLPDAMVEHRAYLAGAGLLLAVASALATPLATRPAARAIAAGLLVLLTVQTYKRNVLWTDPMALWQEAVERSPEAWQARMGYGELLRELGRCDRARPEYETVLRLHPNHARAKAGLDACR